MILSQHLKELKLPRRALAITGRDLDGAVHTAQAMGRYERVNCSGYTTEPYTMFGPILWTVVDQPSFYVTNSKDGHDIRDTEQRTNWLRACRRGLLVVTPPNGTVAREQFEDVELAAQMRDNGEFGKDKSNYCLATLEDFTHKNPPKVIEAFQQMGIVSLNGRLALPERHW